VPASLKAFRRLWRLPSLSLRTRILLLVVVSIVPLMCMGVVRETADYASDREHTYEDLLAIANGTSIAIERDFQLRIAALETLAMSPALQDGDWPAFDSQAHAFLTRQAHGAQLGIADVNQQVVRLYGLQVDPSTNLPRRSLDDDVRAAIFTSGNPVVMNLHTGKLSHNLGFTIDVPVFRDGHVAYDLFLRLTPDILTSLVSDQHVPPGTIIAVADSAGILVGRAPTPDRYLGTPVVPGLWQDTLGGTRGITQAPTLEGVPAVAAFTHIGNTGWVVIVGAPREMILGPMRTALERVFGIGLLMLCMGIGLAMFAARSITRPIEALRRLAESDDPNLSGETGLPDTNVLAEVLQRTAAERRQAVRALAESEQSFRALFERAPNGSILLDPDTMTVIDCNEAAASFVGLDAASFRGRKITDFTLQTAPERATQIARDVTVGQPFQYETRIRGLAGDRDLLIAAAPVAIAGRTLVLLSQIDVTTLRANEERLELARQGADLGIWDWDIVNDTWTWSEDQWRLHGMDPRPDGPYRFEWERVLVPSEREFVRGELQAALQNPANVYTVEYSVVLPDGALRRLLGRGKTIRDAADRPIRMVGINMDVTARYEAEKTRDRLISVLETERSRLASIVASLPIGVGIVDDTGRVVLGNEMMRRFAIYMIPPREGAVNPIREAAADTWIGYRPDGRRIQPEDYPVARALRGETVMPGAEFLCALPDGGETWLRAGARPLRRVEGRVREALVIIQDIDTEKRLLAIQQEINARLEQRVREEMSAREAAQQRAAHAERMHALGQIAGGIAHDFNNVLQAVSGGAALIERRPNDPDRVARNARMISDAAKRGASITSRLLAFARRGDLRAEPIDAGALLNDMAEVLTHTLGGAVNCAVNLPANLPHLFADRGQLETVLVNLATNARDAMPTGGVLTLSAEADRVLSGAIHPAGLTPGAYIRIVVSDTGSGMDEIVLARVTEPFFTTKEPGKGTGLGLAMAKGFAEQSGGSLAIESAVGQGTSISLWLPQTGADTDPISAQFDQGSIGADSPSILLVDDDAIVREILTLSLQDAGYAVFPVDCGAAAMEQINSTQRIDIIVSDLTMPAMDGVTLIRTAQERRPGLPAILLTGYAGDGAALAIGGAMSGAFSLLRKPVSGMQLLERIAALMAYRAPIDVPISDEPLSPAPESRRPPA
jgi:PAS domain S-box-containing protein